MDRGGKIVALVSVPDHGSPYVLRRAARTRKNGVRDQSGGPPVSVWTKNGHQHRSAGVGRTEEGKESVRQGTSLQCEAAGQPGLSFQRLREPGESGAPRVPDGRR